MGSLDSLPRFLVPYYKVLRDYIDTGRIKEAEEYLFNLPTAVYDQITERANGKEPFAVIFNYIHRSKKSNFLKEEHRYFDDENHLT